MQREIKFGTISWINGTQNPIWFAAKAKLLDPEWVPKTYVGLYGTRNTAPKAALSGFPAYQKAKDFRAMIYCKLKVDIDDKTDLVNSVTVMDRIVDPGWTPDFKMTSYPSTLVSFDMSIYSTVAYAGELSPLSDVVTQGRHPNSTITSPTPSEMVLADLLIKFRAGKHTDDIGISSVGSPWHVPWVWCESVLTYSSKVFKVHGCGSIFPSHAWYLNDSQVNTINEAGDASFPSSKSTVTYWPGKTFSYASPTGINVTALNLYPVLSKGVPAGKPQSLLSSETYKTPVDKHPNTGPGGAPFVVVK